MFLGDFWPNVLEESIKEIDMEQQKQLQLMDSSKSESNSSDKCTEEESIGIFLIT